MPTARARTEAVVLLVEEDDDARAAYALVLTELGLDVAAASDADQAARLLEVLSPELVLLEWRASRADGRSTSELVRELRRVDPLGLARPILAFSAAIPLADVAAQLGLHECSEPLDLDRLSRAIDRALGAPRLGPRLARTQPPAPFRAAGSLS